MSGAPYFLRSFLGGKKSSEFLGEEEREDTKIIPIKKGKSHKDSLILLSDSEKEKVLKELNYHLIKALSAVGKLENSTKKSGTDMEKCKLSVIKSQIKGAKKGLKNF